MGDIGRPPLPPSRRISGAQAQASYRARIRALGGRQVLVTLTADRAAAVDRLPGSSDAARIEGLLDALAGWEAERTYQLARAVLALATVVLI